MTHIFLKLLDLSVKASWLIVAVVLARFLLKKAPKRFRIALWALVAIRLISPFSFESTFSVVPNTQKILPKAQQWLTNTYDYSIPKSHDYIEKNRQLQVDMVVPSTLKEDTELTKEISMQKQNSVPVETDILNKEKSAHKSETSSRIQIAVVIWAIGACGIFIYSLVNLIRMKRNISVSLRVKDHIWICDNIDTPFVLGVLRPKIYLPSYISIEQSNYVIKHEQAHIKKFDHLWKLLSSILLVIYWFNPFVWLAFILFSRDIELACDEYVIHDLNIVERKAYSNTLLQLSMSGHQMTPASILGFGEIGVKTRIKQVLSYKKSTALRIVIAVIVCMVLALCFLPNSKERENSFKNFVLTEALIPVDLQNETAKGIIPVEKEDIQKLQKQVRKIKLGKQIKDFDQTKVKCQINTNSKSDGEIVLRILSNTPKDYFIFSAQNKNYSIDKNTEFYTYVQNLYLEYTLKENISENNHDGNKDNTNDSRFEETKKYLSQLPNDEEKLLKAGCFVIPNGPELDQSVWNEFLSKINEEKSTEIVIAQFTHEGDAILDYLSYDGVRFYHVNDNTRDQFSMESMKRYREDSYSYLKVFTNEDDENKVISEVVLTDDNELTYDTYFKLLCSDTYNPDVKQKACSVATFYDMSEKVNSSNKDDRNDENHVSNVLIAQDQITSIVAYDSYTNKTKKLSVLDGSSAYGEIVKYYSKLDATFDKSKENRTGYQYRMKLYDAEDNLLQVVTVYKDAVKINENMYYANENESTTDLMLKLDWVLNSKK